MSISTFWNVYIGNIHLLWSYITLRGEYFQYTHFKMWILSQYIQMHLSKTYMKWFYFNSNNGIIWSFEYPCAQNIVAVIFRESGVHYMFNIKPFLTWINIIKFFNSNFKFCRNCAEMGKNSCNFFWQYKLEYGILNYGIQMRATEIFTA